MHWTPAFAGVTTFCGFIIFSVREKECYIPRYFFG